MENIQDTLSGKTCREHSVPTVERTSATSSKRSAGLKMKPLQFLDLRNGQGQDRFWETIFPLHGELSMLNTSESPRDADACFLSQILMANVPEKYYLSPKACQDILRRASERGKQLPNILRIALERQAHIV